MITLLLFALPSFGFWLLQRGIVRPARGFVLDRGAVCCSGSGSDSRHDSIIPRGLVALDGREGDEYLPALEFCIVWPVDGLYDRG